MKNIFKNRYSTLLLVLTVLLFSGAVAAFYIHGKAKGIGNRIGEFNGTVVGTAIGSLRGINTGVSEGAAAGAEAGLSAEDTKADIKGTMENIGNLEVLVAGVTLKNINQIGDTYKGLYVINGDAVFTVDLNKAELSYSDDQKQVYIHIPTPEIEIYLDQGSTKKLAEVQKFSFTVNAEDGLNAYLNSINQTVNSVRDNLGNYDSLVKKAEEAAINQVKMLAETICGGEKIVEVKLK